MIKSPNSSTHLIKYLSTNRFPSTTENVLILFYKKIRPNKYHRFLDSLN